MDKTPLRSPCLSSSRFVASRSPRRDSLRYALKRTAKLCVALGSLFALSTHSDAADVTSGLVAYWPLNDVNGSVATDYSGNGNNASLSGHPTWTVGKIDASLRFTSNTQNVNTASGVVDTSQS